MSHSRGGLSLGVPPSSLAWGNSDQSPQRQRVHTGGLVEGRSGGLLSVGDAHSVWLRDLANIVVSRGHSRWCPAYVESEQALLNTTEVTQQQCSVSFGWQAINGLTMGLRCGMSPGCGRRWGMPGRAAREQCLWGRYRWWDSKKKREKTQQTNKKHVTFVKLV